MQENASKHFIELNSCLSVKEPFNIFKSNKLMIFHMRLCIDLVKRINKEKTKNAITKCM